jgi:hypothetical protein
MVVGEEVREAAVDVGKAGIAEAVKGAAELGSAEAHAEMADDLGSGG